MNPSTLQIASSDWPQFGGPARNFTCSRTPARAAGQPILWQRLLGTGASGIISDGKTLYTIYTIPSAGGGSRGEDVIIALDAANGKTRWEHRLPIAAAKGQESYTGGPIRAQSTPALLRGKLCALSFHGMLTCLEAATGKPVWNLDLVREFGATPVQFGFSASPLVYKGAFLVHIGGKQTALAALRPENGSVLWKSEPAEPGYSSPVLLRVGETDQIVQMTRDSVLGISPGNGKTLWSYRLPQTGLTNVPTPIALPRGQVLLSGQGAGGTRLLQVSGGPGGYRAAEVWANERAKFFYCNWCADTSAVYGCIDSFLGALDLTTGKELWRERGHAEGNVVRWGDETVILRGDGRLTKCRLSPQGLVNGAALSLLKDRCWAPPTIVGNILYARDDKEIAALNLNALPETAQRT